MRHMVTTVHKEAFEVLVYDCLEQLDPDVAQSPRDWYEEFEQRMHLRLEEVAE